MAAWTGSDMIVFGGSAAASEGSLLNDGAMYSPATDSWRPMSTVNAPSPRLDSCVAWMIDRLLIWGGDGGQLDGGLYDPVNDIWTAVTAADAPSPRARVAWAVSDSQLYFWGGLVSGPNPPIDNGAVWSPDR
jgi:N-acetylneuraminic acid mutarotase